MQIKPSTAADENVGISDVHQLENNIHAGVKYLAFLRDRYFSDPGIEPAIRVDFAWAAYNAGPARIRELRNRAAEQGFDPDRNRHRRASLIRTSRFHQVAPLENL